MRKLYLANPYGFSEHQKRTCIPDLKAAILRVSTKVEIIDPFRDFEDGAPTPFEIADRCGNDVLHCDGLFAVINGCPPDEGVFFELGMAHAWGRKIFLFRDDFRKCSDNSAIPVNLMALAPFNSEEHLKDHFFTSVDEVAKSVTLKRWLLKG